MKNNVLIWPMHDTGLSKKLNFDGVLLYWPGDHLQSQTKPVRSYVQIFRDGCVEIVTTEIFQTSEGQHLIYPVYEGHVGKALHHHLTLLRELGIEPPIFVSLAFIGAKDYSLALVDQFGLAKSTSPIGRDVLIIPETPIYEYASTYHDALRESFDRLWQTCGQFGSPNYTGGQWSAEIVR
jgi:hypothetical protein